MSSLLGLREDRPTYSINHILHPQINHLHLRKDTFILPLQYCGIEPFQYFESARFFHKYQISYCNAAYAVDLYFSSSPSSFPHLHDLVPYLTRISTILRQREVGMMFD